MGFAIRNQQKQPKQGGILSKLFGSKESDCCDVTFEEEKNSGEAGQSSDCCDVRFVEEEENEEVEETLAKG